MTALQITDLNAAHAAFQLCGGPGNACARPARCAAQLLHRHHTGAAQLRSRIVATAASDCGSTRTTFVCECWRRYSSASGPNRNESGTATAPIELLRAHAITSRSWLVAMLERQKRFKNVGGPTRRGRESEQEIVRWYDREDHALFDVCADDHCQRYQGITGRASGPAAEAVRETEEARLRQ